MTQPPLVFLARAAALTLLWLSLASPALGQELVVGPYLQDVTPTSARVMWESSMAGDSRVEWGLSETLGESATGDSVTTEGAATLHDVALTGLSAGTRYFYRVHTGALASEVFAFTTAPDRASDVTFRLVAMSDMQIDRANPTVYGEVVRDGVLGYLEAQGFTRPDDGLSFVLVPGDLVDDGRVYEQWREDFFEPGEPLMSLVPFYPVLGNHEHDSPHYYTYFHMPEMGAPAEPDRYWAMDWANVRVIGLDTNLLLLFGDQEEFLEARLEEACADEATDFVFVSLHHAHQSELWPPGETLLTTQVVERMTRFSAECGKPSVHFYGHTHGYSRGASRDSAHLWINVASAGGNLDYWGEYTQRDYADVSVSQDEYGFVLVEVTGGDDPSFTVRRIGMGDEFAREDNVLRDEITVRRNGRPPERPIAARPRGFVAPSCTTLSASAFADPDEGSAHGATEWQVGATCEFDEVVFERFRGHENWYAEEDTQAGDDLTDEPFAELESERYYCWRVRYRDRELVWSEWSEPLAFVFTSEGDASCDDDTRLFPPRPDAGPPPVPPAMHGPMCGCRAVGLGASAPWALFGLVGMVAWARRRRGR